MTTYTVAIHKGGTGKTAISRELGYHYSSLGKTLLLDLDAQSDLSRSVCTLAENQKTIFELLTGRCDVQDCVVSVSDNLALIPGSIDMINSAEAFSDGPGKFFKIRDILNSSLIKDTFEYCIIDTPADLSVATVNALTASTNLIIPAKSAEFSLNGIINIKRAIDEVKQYSNPSLVVSGILLNFYNPRLNITAAMENPLNEAAKLLNTKIFKARIHQATGIEQAIATKKSIFDVRDALGKPSGATKSFEEFFRELDEDLKNE